MLVKLPNPSTVRFRAMQRGNYPLLVVNEDNGEISIGSKIDREQLCQKNLNCSIEFDDHFRPLSICSFSILKLKCWILMTIRPSFQDLSYLLRFQESAHCGDPYPLDSAFDPDVGENSSIRILFLPMIFLISRSEPGTGWSEVCRTHSGQRAGSGTEVKLRELQLTASDMGGASEVWPIHTKNQYFRL